MITNLAMDRTLIRVSLNSGFVITECSELLLLHSTHALLLLSSLQKKMKYKDKGEIPGDVGVLGLGCGFARLNAVSFTGWALMAV